jgi:GTPase SAR1 family protein
MVPLVLLPSHTNIDTAGQEDYDRFSRDFMLTFT